ncbi:MAG: peptide-methionine (S)-S-oxide reductase [Methylococcaceae bacterium TMED69]|nr:MAG: peptide-methionine (S)-S-oxide reductase [Methylococcaceae bacterium TMED69]
MIFEKKFLLTLVDEHSAVKGRKKPITVAKTHLFFQKKIDTDLGKNVERICFGAGCFWGVEKRFWEIDGVVSTSVGYAGGFTENPTYEEVCSGKTGHTEVVLVTFDKSVVKINEIIKVFWEMHDPTQGFRQGNDVGTQYRSAIYYSEKEHEDALINSKKNYQRTLKKAGKEEVTTEIKQLSIFYFAEDYHQQYLIKNPNGYCSLHGTGCKYVDE